MGARGAASLIGARGAASLMGARGAASLMGARSLARSLGGRHAAVAAITVPARLYIDRSSLGLINLSDYIN